MKVNSGLVSVTIPFYNAERFLSETIHSVLAQSYESWELLLVDDGSSDGSSEIARKIAAQRPDKIHYLEHPDHRNLGVNAARNLGASLSRGEFLAFLDSDDIWLPEKLADHVASMKAHPEAGLMFCSTEWWYDWDLEKEDGQQNHIPPVAPGDRQYSPPYLLSRSYPLGPYGAPCPSSLLLRRSAFDQIGGFDECFNPETFQQYEDIAFLTKVYLNVPVYVSSACLDRNRCNRYSMTRQPIAIETEEAARRFYFRWLVEYLRKHGVADSQIWNSVKREAWYYRLPLPAAKFARRVKRKLARMMAHESTPAVQTGDAASGNYAVEVITAESALDGLTEDWRRLSAYSEEPNVFASFDWYRTWLRRGMTDAGEKRLEPFVVVIRQNQAIVGIAPLVRRIVSRFGLRLRKLEFVNTYSDYNELVVGESIEALTRAVMNYLAKSSSDWDILDLTDLRDYGNRNEISAAAAIGAGLSFRLVPEPVGCPYMSIDGPWSEMKKKKHLRFARRASAGLEEWLGDGFRSRVVEQPQLENGLLERMIRVEAQKQVGGKLSMPFVGEYSDVFQSLFQDLGPQGSMAVVIVEKADQLIAWLFLYRCGAKLWGYVTAYDHSFSAVSPGTNLICAALDYGFELGCDEFDFLRGMDEYKLHWTSKIHCNQRLLLWNRRWRSQLSALAFFRLRLNPGPRATNENDNDHRQRS